MKSVGKRSPTSDAHAKFRHGRGAKNWRSVRGFLRYCVEQEWTNRSPAAAETLAPNKLQATNKAPYTSAELIRILAACDAIGQRPYERLRARAMTLLLRYTALRIGDVALLEKDRIRRGEIYLRTMKNGKVVKLPVPSDLQAALDALPDPRGKGSESKYFFWS